MADSYLTAIDGRANRDRHAEAAIGQVAMANGIYNFFGICL